MTEVLLDVICRCGQRITLTVPIKHAAFIIEHSEGVQCWNCRPQDWVEGKYIYTPNED